MPSLFEQAVDCCGLAPAFARSIIAQACERCGVSAALMGPKELVRVLPYIQQSLSVFLEPQEVNRKIGAMRSLVRSSWPELPAVTAQEEPKTKSTSNSS